MQALGRHWGHKVSKTSVLFGDFDPSREAVGQCAGDGVKVTGCLGSSGDRD